MKTQEMEFTGTVEALDALVKEKRKEGMHVRVTRIGEPGDDERRYRLKMRRKPVAGESERAQ